MTVEPASIIESSNSLSENILSYCSELANLVGAEESLGNSLGNDKIQQQLEDDGRYVDHLASGLYAQAAGSTCLAQYTMNPQDLVQSIANPFGFPQIPASSGDQSSQFTISTSFFEEQWIPESHLPLCTKKVCWPENQFATSLLESIALQHSLLQQQQRDFSQAQLNMHTDRLKEITKEVEAIQSVRKASVFSAEVTEEETEIISKRILLQQHQHSEYEKVELERKIIQLQEVFPYYSREEITYAIMELKETEEDAMLRFGHVDYLHKLRKDIAVKSQGGDDDSDYAESDEDSFVTDGSDDECTERKSRKKRTRASRSRSQYKKQRVYQCVGRLPLDEALAKLKSAPHNPDEGMEGWSSARIRAYKCIKENPNAYYYRFNAPGEQQVNGPWSKEERERFLQRLAVCGADGNWGIFATKIPGRVGYQCANFYRKLLSEGVVSDPNYYKDSKGKWHYRFGTHGNNLQKKRPESDAIDELAEEEMVELEESKPTKVKKTTSKKAKASRSDSEQEPSGSSGDVENVSNRKNDEIVAFPRSMIKSPTTAADSQPCPENPLPGYIDPITLEEVKRPAISPYGHVMGYDSWLKCFVQQTGDLKNTCPLTKKPLKKRELVLLTFENIEQYRDKIVM